MTDPVFFEPDEEWKKQLKARIQLGLQSLIQDAKDHLMTELRKAVVSPEDRKQLDIEYKAAIGSITQLANDQYEAELEKERNQRRWIAGEPMLPGWSTYLKAEQEHIVNTIKKSSDRSASAASSKRLFAHLPREDDVRNNDGKPHASPPSAAAYSRAAGPHPRQISGGPPPQFTHYHPPNARQPTGFPSGEENKYSGTMNLFEPHEELEDGDKGLDAEDDRRRRIKEQEKSHSEDLLARWVAERKLKQQKRFEEQDRHLVEAGRKEEEAKNKAAKAKEQELIQREQEARLKIEEVQKLEEDVKRKEAKLKQQSEKTKLLQQDAQKIAEVALERQAKLKHSEEDAKRREKEVWEREQSVLLREKELNRIETELKRREAEMNAKEETQRTDFTTQAKKVHHRQSIDDTLEEHEGARIAEENRRIAEVQEAAMNRQERLQAELHKRAEEIKRRKREEHTSRNAHGIYTSAQPQATSGTPLRPLPVSSSSHQPQTPVIGMTWSTSTESSTANSATSAPSATSSQTSAYSIHPPNTAQNIPSFGNSRNGFVGVNTYPTGSAPQSAPQHQAQFTNLRQEESRRQKLAGQTLQSRNDMQLVFDGHKRLWARLPQKAELSWHDFPWPMRKAPATPDEISSAFIESYIRSEFWPEAIQMSIKDRIKESIKRWHPDRFETKFLPKVVGSENDMVKQGSRKVARYLSDLFRKEIESRSNPDISGEPLHQDRRPSTPHAPAHEEILVERKKTRTETCIRSGVTRDVAQMQLKDAPLDSVHGTNERHKFGRHSAVNDAQRHHATAPSNAPSKVPVAHFTAAHEPTRSYRMGPRGQRLSSNTSFATHSAATPSWTTMMAARTKRRARYKATIEDVADEDANRDHRGETLPINDRYILEDVRIAPKPRTTR